VLGELVARVELVAVDVVLASWLPASKWFKVRCSAPIELVEVTVEVTSGKLRAPQPCWDRGTSSRATRPSSRYRHPFAIDEQGLRPYRRPPASWSLLRSLPFHGAVKRLDTP
jgi:hypothetical protein